MKKSKIYHPLLFALYPILTLYAYNIEQLPFVKILVPTAIVLGGTLVFFLLINLLTKNYEKSALIVSGFSLLFFSFGHVNDFIRYFSLIIYLISIYYLLKSDKSIIKITQIANMFSIGMVAIAFVNISVSMFSGTPEIELNKFKPELVRPEIEQEAINNLPDIYYIILDGYARQDILRQIYRYDNSEFIDHLRQKGFQIANKSRSNYCQSLLSASSALNLSYLNKLTDEIGEKSEDRKPLMDMIRHSYVFDFLKQYNYDIMAISTGYSGTEIRNADYFMAPGLSLNEFENALINYTPIPKFLRKFPMFNQYAIHRNLVKFSFEKLADLPETNNPKIVMAHIVTPHPPFVFGPNGEELDYDRIFEYSDGSHYMTMDGASRVGYIKKYCGQVYYVNNQVTKLVDKILSQPGRKPIIIFQSDHGPGSLLDWESLEDTYTQERLSILNVYYLPDCDSTIIYDSITPVNSFRTIFNYYFGTDFEMLEDRSYYTKWSAPYQFYDVTELMNQDHRPKIMFR